MVTVDEWRDIPGYDGMYQINSNGQVRSWKVPGTHRRSLVPKYLKIQFGRGCPKVPLYDSDGEKRGRSIRQLLIEAGFPVEPKRGRQRHPRDITKLDAVGNVVARYEDIHDAAKANFCSVTLIHYYCQARNKSLFDDKYTFRYGFVPERRDHVGSD